MHRGPSDFGIVEPEPQRLDQVQRGVGGRAGAGDVARVGRDFRFDQRDVQRQLLSSHL
jgi:hypothetical protein